MSLDGSFDSDARAQEGPGDDRADWHRRQSASAEPNGRATRIAAFRAEQRWDPRQLAMFRLFDIFVASVAILVFLPIILLIAAAVRITSRGPVLFMHRRVGMGGRFFPCLKFRTMRRDADEVLDRLLANDPVALAEWQRDHKLRNDPRITAVGSLLRKSSLDELPQLLNVIVGHMSIVGPRPIVASEIARYGLYFADYCAVRPGLTGVWQISGRNDVTYEERVAMDSRYAREKSLAADFVILLRTLPAVVAARGSY